MRLRRAVSCRLARLANTRRDVSHGLARLANICRDVSRGLADTCRAMLRGLARLANTRFGKFLRKMSVTRESREFGASGHCLILTLLLFKLSINGNKKISSSKMRKFRMCYCWVQKNGLHILRISHHHQTLLSRPKRFICSTFPRGCLQHRWVV